MRVNPIFPPTRLTEPTRRRAERDIYQALEASDVPGRALYEVKVDKDSRQVDLVVWIEGIAVFVVQIKGGIYVLDRGELWLVTHRGRELQEGLLADIWDDTMVIQKFLKRSLHRGTYLVPVMALPDMAEDEAIRDMAARRSVQTLFGMADWVERLIELAEGPKPIKYPPTAASIEAEVMAIMPELAPAPNSSPTSPQVVIQNVEQLHIHVGPEGVETLGLPDLTADA